MGIEPKLEISYFDLETKKLGTIKGEDLEKQIDKLKQVLEYALKKMQKLGNYELSEFTASAGVELGAWILKADGSVSFKWEKPKSTSSK